MIVIQNAKRVYDFINSDKSEASRSIDLREFLAAYQKLIEEFGIPNENGEEEKEIKEETNGNIDHNERGPEFWKKWENFGRGLQLSTDQVHHAVEIFYEQDTDGSGEIEIDEFVKLMSKFFVRSWRDFFYFDFENLKFRP